MVFDLTYLAVLMSVCGGYCLTRAKAGYMVICMILYISASSIWIYYAYNNAIFSLMINAMIYIFIEIFGLIKWYKQYRSEVQAYQVEKRAYNEQLSVANEIQVEDKEVLVLMKESQIVNGLVPNIVSDEESLKAFKKAFKKHKKTLDALDKNDRLGDK